MTNQQDIRPSTLYHYTNLETLALILENRTIRLMPLTGVDDRQESMTADSSRIASFVFVSCWTDDSKESIPMWRMYASLEAGVRIALPSFPFEFYPLTANTIKAATGSLPKKPYHITQGIRSVIPPKDLYNGFYYAPSEQGINEILHKVTYTDDTEKLYPRIVTRDTNQLHLWLTEIGVFKSTYWKFQKEWRYIVWSLPEDPLERKVPLFEQMLRIIEGLNNGTLKPSFDYYDLKIREDALREIKVTLSPKMSGGNRVLAKTLLEKHGLLNALEESSLTGLL